MFRRLTTLVWISLTLSACATNRPKSVDITSLYQAGSGRDMVAVLGRLKEYRRPESPEPSGGAKRTPSTIIRAYIHPHENAQGDWVEGHWIDLKIEDERWADESP